MSISKSRWVVLVLLAVVCPVVGAGSGTDNECERFSDTRFHPVDVWITPSIPADGVFPVPMRAPTDASGARVRPENLAQSNCLLREMLDERVTAAIVAAMEHSEFGEGRDSADEQLDRVMERLSSEIATRLLLPGSQGQGYLLSMMANIENLFQIPPAETKNPPQLARFFYKRGIFNRNQIAWLVLLSYAKSQGVSSISIDELMLRLKSLDVTQRASETAP